MTQEALLPTHYIRVSNNSGAAVFDQFSDCAYTLKQNGLGSYQFTIDGNDPRVSYFTTDALIEIYRALPGVGIPYYREFVGLHQTPLKKTDESGKRTFTSFGNHLNDLLARRVVAWQKGRAEAHKTNNASVALKQYVLQNCGIEARADLGRVRNGVMLGFGVEDDSQIQGGIWEGDRSMEVVYDVAREIATKAGFMFEITNDTQHLYYFRTAWTFGEDRTFTNINSLTGRNGAGNTPVVFSTERGTAQYMEYEEDRAGEKNAVFATGTVNGVDQTIFVESENAYDSPWNDREAVTTGGTRQDTTISELLTQAQETLSLNQMKRIFRFKPRQTSTALYGRDYKLAYQVTTRYDVESIDQTIWTVKVKINDDSSEDIEMELFE